MFVTFFEDFEFTPIKRETYGAARRRKALASHTITFDTSHIDSVRRVLEKGEWKNIVSVFNGANEFKVSDDTYLSLLEILNGITFDGTEDARHFKMLKNE